MRKSFALVCLLGALSLAGCGGSPATPAAPELSSASSAAQVSTSSGVASASVGSSSSADSSTVGSGTGSGASSGDSGTPTKEALAALCEKHCEPLSLEGTSPCDSEASCDENVAKAAAAVDAFVTDAQAQGIDIRSASGFKGLFTSADSAHKAYESSTACQGATADKDLPSDCFSSVAEYQLTVQLIGMGLERMS